MCGQRVKARTVVFEVTNLSANLAELKLFEVTVKMTVPSVFLVDHSISAILTGLVFDSLVLVCLTVKKP